jgi:AraC family transcriptional regulator
VDQRLGYGEFCGRILRSRSVAGFSLTETRYAPRARVAPHSHESGYICLVRHGSYNETYGRKGRTCRPLTLAFHPPHEIHSESFHDSHVLSFNIELGPSWPERIGPYSKLLESPAEFQGGKIAGLALRLYNEFRLMDDLSALAIEGLALEMIAEASRARLRAAHPNTPPPWIEQARAILHAHFDESLPIGHLARSVGVHPVYLSSVFRAHYRCSIAEYLRQLRVEHACREIIKPDAQLADVALASGFSHQSHFTRTFKRITGLTPGQYRTYFQLP